MIELDLDAIARNSTIIVDGVDYSRYVSAMSVRGSARDRIPTLVIEVLMPKGAPAAEGSGERIQIERAEAARIAAWLREEADAARKRGAAKPEQSPERALAWGECLAYEEAAAAVENGRHYVI